MIAWRLDNIGTEATLEGEYLHAIREEFFEIIKPILKCKISGLRQSVVEPFTFL
jgi:hypothetical protein